MPRNDPVPDERSTNARAGCGATSASRWRERRVRRGVPTVVALKNEASVPAAELDRCSPDRIRERDDFGVGIGRGPGGFPCEGGETRVLGVARADGTEVGRGDPCWRGR